MPNIFNRDFSGGWNPSRDASNSPQNVLLRADNLDLQDEGILSLREGSELLSTVNATEIDSVQAVELNGSEVILFAGGDQVYKEGPTSAGVGLGFVTDGDDDTAIDSTDSHALIASGTVKKKYDGTTVRNWGIATPDDAPDVAGIPLTSKTIANFSQASAEFSAAEGTIAYVTGVDGVANAALGLTPAVGTGRAEITYNFSAATNLLDFNGAEGGDFDLFEFWFNDLQPTKFLFLSIMFGCDTGSDHFQENGYFYEFGTGLLPIGLTQSEIQQAKQEVAAKGESPEPPGGGDIPPSDPRFPGVDRREDQAEERKDRRSKI